MIVQSILAALCVLIGAAGAIPAVLLAFNPRIHRSIRGESQGSDHRRSVG
jgi:hypothetical protein